MSDLISRQAAIATAISGRVRTLPTTEDGENWIRVNEVRDSLLSLPTAQPSWIPVSERLPKEGGIYLVTLKTDGVEYFESEFPNGFVYVSTYDAVTMNWGYGGKNVIAWMLLPEPYEEDKEKENGLV